MKSINAGRTATRFGKLEFVLHAMAIGGLFVAVTIGLGGLIIGRQAPAPTPPAQKFGADLGGPERHLTHLTTDKPIYRTGEKVYVRGVVLRADGHSPMSTQNGFGMAGFEIKGPKGETVNSGYAQIANSTIGFSWDIPEGQAGGEYTVRISHPNTGDAPAERKFDIRAYRAPRLKSQIVFVRDGYGPGDTVSANLHVERAEGGIPAGAKVTVVARIDGEDAWTGNISVDPQGNASASFKLPAAIERGEGTIAMTITDGGAVETATKTIPILLQTLDLTFYPEGGDLIAGLPNRVYVEGKTPAQKPADMAGVIVNAAGREVAAFRTEHEGRGRFSFTPVKGERYSLRVTEPSGIKKTFPLPATKDSGAVIGAVSDMIPKQKDVVVRIAATASGNYNIALTQRGKELAFKSTTLKAAEPVDVAFTVPRSVDGVVVVTVYDEQKKPMAERLLFRQPEHNLNVKVTPDRADYVPGDKVTLRVVTTDDAGKPVGAMVGLTVTDSSVLEMIGKREQAPRLPVMALIENDVRNLSDAHVYLDEANPRAPLALDLLLGTQGWRRFATVDTAKFVAAYSDAALRALAIRTEPTGMAFDFFNANVDRDDGVRFKFEVDEAARNVQVVEEKAVKAAKPMAAPAPPPAAMPAPAPARPAAAAAAPPPPLVPPQGQGMAFDRVGPAEMVLNNPMQMMTVREYAHTRRPNWTEGSREDFAETVYWNAAVKTDAKGAATVSFVLSDSVTAFRVLADGFAPDGALGSSVSDVESVRPFFIEPKIPLQVTSGDVIQLPIAMVNGTSHDLRSAQLTAKAGAGLKVTFPENGGTLRAKERARRMMQIEVGKNFSGAVDFTVDASAGAYRDTVSRKIVVQPFGFPLESSKGGILEPNTTSSLEFTLPEGMIPGSVTSTVAVYPTPLASMTEALQALLQEPFGCFEQTSSTSYPMVMAQQYFLTHSGINPAIIEKTKGLLDNSYKKLTGFESKSKGYEWFGADPGHEALTAYGLLQFTDMAQVREVDKDMLQRTRAWLLARRNSSGGFERNARALDSFGGAPQDTTNAYITWALLESGEKGLDKEIAAVRSSANATEDSYIIALGANVLHVAGDKAGARSLMDKLVKVQQSGGSVKGAVTSITRSGGDALAIETTSLAVLAWLRDPSYAPNVEKGVKWLVESNKSGRFGSTQSTILALRAIVAYDASRARPKTAGRLVLTVDGRALGAPVAFTPETQGALVMPEFGKELEPGKHTIALRMEDGSSMPFSMSVKYHASLPNSAAETRIGVDVTLKDAQLREGAVTEAVASIVNRSAEAIPTPVAIVGIPGGLEVRHDQLKELVKSGKIDAYEVIGREVVLYWRAIKGKDKFDVSLSLVAAVPGSYTGPASRAYLYYTDELKTWAPGLKVNIAAAR
jgi:uncharacterized protein YfaS (alpha-2-macroglobulin family)